MKVPTTPCPIEGVIPFHNTLCPIKSKRPHPILIWLYTIHVKSNDGTLWVHHNISQEEIVNEIDLQCRFKIGDTVELGPFQRRRIRARKWDFRAGDVNYRIEGSGDRDWYCAQTELVRRIEQAANPL